MKLTELNAFFDFIDILMENRVEFVKKTFGNKLQTKIDQDSTVDETDANEFIDRVSQYDPSNKKLYTQWLVTKYIKGQVKAEDLYKSKDDLTVFDKVKHTLDKKDINQYKTPAELYAAVKDKGDVESKNAELRRIKDSGAKRIYEDDELLILSPKTEEAACHYGKGTRWCTAATGSHNMFNDHNEQGPMYIIIDKKTNEKWQWHFESEQFMDAGDDNHAPYELVSQYPQLQQVFDSDLTKHNILTPARLQDGVANANDLSDLHDMASDVYDIDSYYSKVSNVVSFINLISDMVDQNPDLDPTGYSELKYILDDENIPMPPNITALMTRDKEEWKLPLHNPRELASIVSDMEDIPSDTWYDILQSLADHASSLDDPYLTRHFMQDTKKKLNGKVPRHILTHYPLFDRIL